QHRVRQQLLQPPVLLFQRLQLAGVGDLHPAEPRSPLVECRIADAVLPAHIGRRQSGRMLLQHLDDLLFGKSALAHVRLPKERTLPKIGDIYGEQVTRHALLRTGLRPKDHENRWGHKYSWSLEELSADWLRVRQNAVDVRLFSGC